ncbi:MAG: ABC transporter ATP-binding protein [Luteibaculaceae bacterium]
MISVENISKHYQEVQVLKSVSLTVKPKEVVSLTGPSGAGKTTLLQIIGTLESPSEGKVFFEGININTLDTKKQAEFRNKSLGFVFQFHNLLPEFTALENVMLPGLIAGTAKKEVQENALKLLDKLGLSHRISHKPMELSGGEQQRVAVCRALINQPKLVLADEPSGNLDSKNAKELHELFFSLRDELGITFLIVTHNPDLANLTDRQIKMADGKIIAE